MPRRKVDTQLHFDYQPPTLKITEKFRRKYQQISGILDACPKILDLVHRDLAKPIERAYRNTAAPARFRFTSDNILRFIIVQTVEGLSLRDTTVRIDDSSFLRRFSRIHEGPMMDHSVLCRLRNAIKPRTWKSINHALAQMAVRQGCITGDSVRIDTTLVETNIHWPTDASLLWDSYRTLGKLIEAVRDRAPEFVGTKRLRYRTVKRYFTKISRRARGKSASLEKLKPLYTRLIPAVERIYEWTNEILIAIRKTLAKKGSVKSMREWMLCIVKRIEHDLILVDRVIWQATERVLKGRQVHNDDKIFSIFEEHTELLKRGKVGKSIEFGHMVGIHQVQEKFITRYEVFETKPIEHELLDVALESHRELFGHYPDHLAADKGFWKSKEEREELEKKVNVLAIAKKGRRTEQEDDRERSESFRAAQRFRAGVEGTISFLKRTLGLARIVRRGFQRFSAAVGCSIFAHNLLILTRT